MVRSLILICALVASFSLFGCSQAENDPLDAQSFVVEASIADIHEALIARRITCHAITQAYLDRIAAYDEATGLNAITEINTHALETADAIDAQLHRRRDLAPLTCIPMLIKDNTDTFDLPTTGGSRALMGSIPPDDAFIIARLRQAGAIILAKTNMAEWAFAPQQTVSSSYGTTANAYDRSRTPAGSSGGTASGIAASFGVVGLGTDTGNSIRGPASHTGLVGIRPTIGLVSRDGIIPLFADRDVAGPLARTVSDAALVLSVIAGPDENDPYTNRTQIADFTDALDPRGLRNARIGILRSLASPNQSDARILSLFEAAIDDLGAAGAEIIDPVEIPDFARHQSYQNSGAYLCNRFRYDMRSYFESLGAAAPFQDVEDVWTRGIYDPQTAGAFAYFVRGRMDAPPAEWSPPCPEFQDHPGRQAYRRDVIQALDDNRLDAILYPTWTYPPASLQYALSEYRGDNSQIIAPSTGLPALTVPMGFVDGLPAGLQFLGRPFDEAGLIRLAYSYEQSTQHRIPPSGYPSLAE